MSNNKTEKEKNYGWWWLRSPGFAQDYVACVSNSGSLSYNFEFLRGGCVRPAIWIDLESGIF